MPLKTETSIALPVKNGYRIVRFEDIIRCEAAGNYTKFFLADGAEFSICLRLKEVEGMLPEEEFYRVHRSHLVNLEWVEMWVRENGVYILLKDGKAVPISKNKKNNVKLKLKILRPNK